MHRRPQLTLAIAALAIMLAGLGPTATGQSVPGTSVDGARIDKIAWWNAQKVDVETPATAVTAPPPGIDEGQIVVRAQNTDTVAYAAIGVAPDLQRGATVNSFTLSIAEADTQANQGTSADGIVIQACAIEEFWVQTFEGDIGTLPSFDCSLGAVGGVRDDDGIWTFDLTVFAQLWLDSFGTLEPNGVMLLSSPEASALFQAVFEGSSITGTFDAEPAKDDESLASTIPPPTSPPTTTPPTTRPIGANSPSIIAVPTTAPPTTQASVVATTAPPVVETAAPPVSAPVRASATGQLFGNFPVAALLFLLPLFLAVMFATSYWLGPAGQPVTHIRQRGVSRALAAAAAARSTTLPSEDS